MLTDIIYVEKKNCLVERPVSIQNLLGKDIKTIPNPASDRIEIVFDTEFSSEVSYTFIGALGQIVLSGTIPAGQLVTGVPPNLPPGIYQLSFFTLQDMVSQKLVIQP